MLLLSLVGSDCAQVLYNFIHLACLGWPSTISGQWTSDLVGIHMYCRVTKTHYISPILVTVHNDYQTLLRLPFLSCGTRPRWPLATRIMSCRYTGSPVIYAYFSNVAATGLKSGYRGFLWTKPSGLWVCRNVVAICSLIQLTHTIRDSVISSMLPDVDYVSLATLLDIRELIFETKLQIILKILMLYTC